jgi:non-ribosomal peptide synthase protein (TIGR01720 family)
VIAGGRLRVSLRYSGRQYRRERMRDLIRRFEQELLRVIEYCVQREETELTPSDFTYKGLSIELVDNLF